MCGIAGRIGLGATKTNVQKMSEAIAHRGPDASDIWLNDGVALAHQRLAIIDIAGGKQPMKSASGRWILIFNGEIYNFRALKTGLLREYPYKTQSDTEVILAALELWGDNALSRLEGMFAIAAWDVQEQRLLLARDGQGIKPLYFSKNGADFVFGSEVSALLASGLRPVVDESNLDVFLDLRFVPSPHTLFSGIKKLPPGHFLWIELGGSIGEPKPFDFNAPLINCVGSRGELVDQILQSLLDAVERQMVADVPLGVLLSGGIDSGAVAAAAIRSGNPVSTFCVGYNEEHSSNEFLEARRTSELLGTDHHELRIDTKSAIDIMPTVVRHLEEPVVTSSVFSFYLLCESVAKYRKVVLSGQGADEPWGGYGRHQVAALEAILAPIIRATNNVLPSKLQKNDTWKRLLEAYSSQDELKKIIGLHTLFPGSERGQIREVSGNSETYFYLGRLLNALPDNGTFFERLLALEVRSSLPDNLLLLGDKLSMASGLEVRVPFLDPRYLEKIEMLPGSLRRGGLLSQHGKMLHKTVCGALLPKEIVLRPKKGFQTPIERWMKLDLGHYLYEIIDQTGSFSRKFLEVDYAKDLIERHRSGRHGNLERQLFAIWILEEWYRVFFSQSVMKKPFVK